jgi:ectoine hydroxylase-related dioxygenase (phytanoyl-CoA dioxygenase family)
VALPELAGVFAHNRILALVKLILGDDNVVFTGHCDAHMNMLSGWHKDSGEAFGGYFRGDYFLVDDCRVYKIALYLQDSDHRSALRVRSGSHQSASILDGRELQIDTRVGDLVIFDVRLSHTGQRPDPVEKMIKALNALLTRNDRTREDARLTSALKAMYWRIVGRQDRLSLFFTYGYPNSYTYDFSFFNISRQNKQSRVRDLRPPPELCARLRGMGVASYDPRTHELWEGAHTVGRDRS